MKNEQDVLEQNVSSLLETGGEPPRISDAARARIRGELVTKFGVAEVPRTRARTPLVAASIGVLAAAAIALIVLRFVGKHEVKSSDTLADGSTYVAAPGGKVTVISARHVRVEGAALLDVAPGKGTFTVDTARGRVEVLGTRFYVDGEAERTIAAVVRGEVKLATDAGEVLLHAGEQGIAEAGRAPVRGPAPRLSELVSWAKGARHEDKTSEPVHHGTLFARDPGIRSHPPWGHEYPLPIAKLGVDVVVEDRVARVALDQTFRNESDETLEGVYRFAIPPDAAIQRLAMYVDGKLEESAVVERMQARRIYEELVYRRVDPALLEWAGNGRLSLRVYPIPARQDKRLMLAYTQSLPALYDDWTLTIPLPEVDQPVGELDATVRVKGCASCELTSTSHKISVAKNGDDAVVTYRRSADKLGDSFVLHVRDARHSQLVAAKSDDTGRYLMVRAPVELDRTPRAYHPRTWVILDDVSASRSKLELRAQQDLTDAFLRELDENDKVAIVAFDVEARTKLAPTRVLDVDPRAVRKALDGEGGVGATDFEAALAAATKLLDGVAADDAMIVYLGDGVITSGARQLDALRTQLSGKAHFVGVGVGDGTDTQTLTALAQATGGYATTIDLADDVAWRAFDLVAALHTARVTGIAVKLVDARGSLIPATNYLGSPQLADGEELELVSKLAGDGTPAAVELDGVQNGAPWHHRIALDSKRHDTAGYLPRLWAQRHIAARLLAKHEPVALPPCSGVKCPTEPQAREERDEAIRKEVVALGKKYFLLSRHTSLLVLENDEMYQQYGVAKGAGDTWAPYAMPATIPVVARPVVSNAPPANVAVDAELVRSQLQIFYEQPQYRRFDGFDAAGGVWTRETAIEHARDAGILGVAGFGVTRGGGGFASLTSNADFSVVSGPMGATVTADPTSAAQGVSFSGATSLENQFFVEKNKEQAEGDFVAGNDEADHATRRIVATDELVGKMGLGVGGGRGGMRGRSYHIGTHGHGSGTFSDGPMMLVRYTYPSDVAFDDVTALVPALLPDDADAWRAQLVRGAGKHTIDDAARNLLTRAHDRLAEGMYRWGDRELAVDGAHRIGWRVTTDAGLAETASYDGSVWTRRYSELGLDATRAVGDDDVALALAHLPVWIADPAHYARYFDVSARGAHEIVLAHGKQVALVLLFDDHDRLTAIHDAGGAELVAVTWSAGGPMAARVLGEPIAVGFTAASIGNAVTWAHGTSQAGLVVELPGHLATFWQSKLATLPAGSAEWRHAERQLMVAFAATGDRNGLYGVYEQLRAHGGVERGDLVLAGGGIATATTDAQFAAALAPLAREPLARYLIASRAYGKAPRPERLAPETHDGVIGSLWSLRHASAELAASRGKQGVDAVLAIDTRAPLLRLIGAASLTRYYEVKPADVARAWDALATGPYTNIARAQAAQGLMQRGDYEGAADQIARLANGLDLSAAPGSIGNASYVFQSSRRGPAGWQVAWATWRDRVLAGNSYAHVMAIVPLANGRPTEVLSLLARAAELAGDDTRRQVEIAQVAVAFGQGGWAESIVKPLLAKSPTRELYQLAADLAIAQGKTADALGDLEAAQDLVGDEAADIATVRAELGQIIAVARQLALSSSGGERQRAIARAVKWGDRWRAIDPGNVAIDETLGELLLAVGDRAGAWRQLSSTIERDPWSGQGYMTVADAFEREGKVSDALAFWHQAVVIDQTNPTPRLREAQALIALGRTSEGDAILKEIVSRHWHEAWQNVAWQAQSLLDRGKQQR
jgi:hypothetical protein